MPANTSIWTFSEIGGENRTLKLEDHAAPHGRPRKKPVVETELEQREDTVRYAGNSFPTRHLFGAMQHDQQIDGRLSDSYWGAGFARKKRREIEDFVGAGVQCLISWDDLISVFGFIKSVKFGIESGGEMTYRIEYFVDSNLLSDDKAKHFVRTRGPQDITAELNQILKDMKKLQEIPGLRGSIFDSVGSLISSVASITAALNTVAQQVDSFANAPFQMLNRLLAVLDQFRTAVQSLRQTYDDLQTNVALERDNVSDGQQFWNVKAQWGESSLKAMAIAIEMERAVAVAQQGQIKAFYIAKEGDTWDQVSRAAFNGSADRAKDIREANGIEPGANPVPGTEYMVPV